MQNLSLNFFGLNVTFKSNNLLFSTVFRDKFGNFLKGSTQRINPGTVNITCNESFKKAEFSWQKIDAQIQIDTNKNAIEKKHFYLGQVITARLMFSLNAGVSSIELVEKKSPVFFVLNVLSRGQLRRQLYQNILKLYIEQPLYHFVCKQNNLYCLHASGVTKKSKGILFYGLNGVGKSTLAQYLIQNYGYKQLSDNYTLISDSKMYATPESVRLAQDSIAVLNAEATSSFGFGKMNIAVKSDGVKTSQLSKIIFLSRGDAYSIKKLKETDFKKLLRLQQINGEDVQSSVLANLSYFSEQTNYGIQNCTYYHVSVSSFTDLEKVAHEL